MRLTKYGVLQLRLLDMYIVKRVFVPERIRLNNRRLFPVSLKREDMASFSNYEPITDQNPYDLGFNVFN